MVDFTLSKEQCQLRDLAHKFAVQSIRPIAAEVDENEEVPWETLKEAHRIGLLSYYLPEAYGGGGVESLLTRLLVYEELFWGCAGLGSILGATTLCATPILLAATEAQKSKYLSRFSDPDKLTLGAFALSEPSAGSDIGGMTTQAHRTRDRYILNGQKAFITNAGIADIYIVFATVDISQKTKGITAFILEKEWPGVIPGKKEKKLGIHASHVAALTLKNVEVPLENRLGAEGEGFPIAMRTFDITRTHVAIGAVGLARASYEYALAYAQGRKQFGQAIASFQAIAFMLAEMATKIDAARLLAWRAAWLNDQGRRCTKEASMAKAYAADVAMQVTTDAVQILGGYGYMREYPVAKWMRDAKSMQIYEGTTEIQRLIIARELRRGWKKEQ